MTTYTFSTESPADVDTGLLILPVFEGGDPGPGVRETGLRDAFAAAKLTGKKGETLVVTGRDGDGFAAGAALLAGGARIVSYVTFGRAPAIGDR